MVTLAKRATPSQRQIMRIVEGAVKNASDSHPEWEFTEYIARSIAKRATGTLSAQWLGVLAAKPSISVENSTVRSSQQSVPHRRMAPRRGAPQTTRRAPLSKLWKHCSWNIGAAKKTGQQERAQAFIEMARKIAELQQLEG